MRIREASNNNFIGFGLAGTWVCHDIIHSWWTITPSMQIRIWRNVRVNRLFISKNKSSGFLYVNFFLHLPLSNPTDSISYVRITAPSEAVDTNSVWYKCVLLCGVSFLIRFSLFHFYCSSCIISGTVNLF